MKKLVKPSTVRGDIQIPASKSMMQRAIAAALLAEGTSILLNPSFCDDAIAAMGMAEKLGAQVEKKQDRISIKGGFTPGAFELNCGESGLGVRLFTPLASLHNETITLNGEGSLKKRPVSMIETPLKALGVECTTNNGYLPISVKVPLQGGTAEVDGSVSSQQLTGLLMALPKAKNDSTLQVHNLQSKPYIDMTIQLLNDFGVVIQHKNYEEFKVKGSQKYKAQEYFVEGDWSGAAFFVVAAALTGQLTLKGLRHDSTQADIAILSVAEQAGAIVEIQDNNFIITKDELNAFEFDATDCPDLFPPLVALAANCEGVSVFMGVNRLKHKESDRGIVLQTEFAKLGITIELKGDLMFVHGGEITGGTIHSNHDHRIAMAGAVAALLSLEPIKIECAEAINKSYPKFFDHLKQIAVEVEDCE